MSEVGNNTLPTELKYFLQEKCQKLAFLDNERKKLDKPHVAIALFYFFIIFAGMQIDYNGMLPFLNVTPAIGVIVTGYIFFYNRKKNEILTKTVQITNELREKG